MAIVESERNLLFGMLALQNRLVDQHDPIAAFQCWSRERSRPMARIMVERGALTEHDHAMLEGLVRRHVQKHEGEGVVCLGASQEPDAEDSLPLFSIDDAVDLLHSGDLTIGAADSANCGEADSLDWSFSLGQTTSEGGRFRLLRHPARGGIGIVSVALDSELHREVALKQIQPQHADDPTSRARFLVEAEVTGRLEHPGVVPVYGLGTSEKGRPFYAMRFVRGQSLKEAAESFHQADLHPGRDPAERTLALRQLLRRFIDVCNAIAYAHSRGVIHRDLKPANILLGPYGETLGVDWGLAKVVGRDDPTPQPDAEMTLRPASLSGSSDTQMGTAIGTPAYMSPEQSDGRLAQIGPASDIYSLGSTLYCITTGKPPLDEGNFDDMLLRLRRGEIHAPRKINPRVPAALEAIILKAMAARVADRYPSAHDLALDLDRWLADEPVWRDASRSESGRGGGCAGIARP
jgi:tRNA A-37 threonylcarbamoyl transferase component Bud32